MPALRDHQDQAGHNLKFFSSIDLNQYPDWGATVLFYAALHHIDAFLASKNIHPGIHDIRDKYVQQVSELKAIYNNYCFLKSHSRTARYTPPVEFTKKDIEDLRTDHFNLIVKTLNPSV